MSTILLSGCDLGDSVFTTDKNIFGVEITWNVTRIQRDADAGKFGPAEAISMALLPPMDERHSANIDWRKVGGMIAVHQNSLHLSVLVKPALQIVVKVKDVLHRIPIDGNHRISARRVFGFDNFECYVVPETMEIRYRVIERLID